MTKTLLLLSTSVLLMFSCTSQQETSTANSNSTTAQSAVVAKRVSASEFKSVMNANPEAQLIDVRTPAEYQGGKIGEAQNIDFLSSDFAARIGELDKSKLTLIYCQSGGRSSKALAQMKSMGFENVLELEGGYGSWR